MNSGLVVTDLYAAHGSTAILHGVNLAVAEHTLACILGPSGCGKTTLLRVIAGFHRPSAGQVELDGRSLDQPPGRHIPAERRRIGYIPQEVALFPHLSVAANIGFGVARNRRASKTAELLELTDLTQYADRHPHELSGGQQQRVALARALAPEPELLLLDEPFSALDATLRARVRGDVATLLRKTRTTAILVTHDATEALGFADVVAVMNDGHILQIGTPEQLHTHPTHVAVAHALGEANILDAELSAGWARTVLGRLPLYAAPTLDKVDLVLVRPEQLIVSIAPSAGTVSGRVRGASYQGTDYRLEVDIDGRIEPIIARTSENVPAGSVVQLSVQGSVQSLSGSEPWVPAVTPR